jgi:hypothetical protein
MFEANASYSVEGVRPERLRGSLEGVHHRPKELVRPKGTFGQQHPAVPFDSGDQAGARGATTNEQEAWEAGSVPYLG